MTTKTIDCVECGEAVPYGRLSCPACGALLASVAGPRPRAAASSDDRSSAAAPVVVAPVEAAPAKAASTKSTATKTASAKGASGRAAPPIKIEPLLPPLPDPVASDASPNPWPPLETPEPVLVPRPFQLSSLLARDDFTPVASVPSAYRPSAFAMSPATAGGPSWPGASPAAVVASRAVADEPEADEPEAAEPDVSPTPVVDVARFAEIAGWFVVVGSSMSILGFLLPWSVTVIGARSFGGYFGSWGLASPTHVIVLLALLAVLALGVLRTPVPEWLRTGVFGLGLGGLLVGLVWPYAVGPLGADVGVLVTLMGGLSLVIGGAVASWATRHVEADPRV